MLVKDKQTDEQTDRWNISLISFFLASGHVWKVQLSVTLLFNSTQFNDHFKLTVLNSTCSGYAQRGNLLNQVSPNTFPSWFQEINNAIIRVLKLWKPWRCRAVPSNLRFDFLLFAFFKILLKRSSLLFKPKKTRENVY